MKILKIFVFALLTMTAACSDEKKNDASGQSQSNSLAIYKQNTDELRKGYVVEIAETRETMAKGLMGRSSLDKDAGFLFNVKLIPSDMEIAMWMKDTLFPLDMVFIDDSGKVYYIYENAVPNTTTAIRAPSRPSAVLEINGGQVKEYGIEIGDTVKARLFGNM